MKKICKLAWRGGIIAILVCACCGCASWDRPVVGDVDRIGHDADAAAKLKTEEVNY